MVHIPSLLLGLSVAGSTTAARPYAYDRPAKISLFDPSSIAEVSNPAVFDCGAEKAFTDVSLNINTCLWGEFPLLNFKIKTMPTCASGAKPVAFFYPTTSCTGNPSFRSDKHVGDQEYLGLENKCLASASPTTEWSMIFRCGNLESQAIASNHYVQATSPSYDLDKSSVSKSKASDGVVTPHSSFDCTIWKPKEPTYLPADTCLTLEGFEGRGIFINKPAVCAHGSVAFVDFFPVPNCEFPLIGSEGWASEGGLVLDKKCFRDDTTVRSMRFRCNDKEMERYEDLPPYEPAEVEPLVLQEAQMPTQDDEESLPVVDSPTIEKIFKSTFGSGTSTQSTKPRGGKIQPFYLEECRTEDGRTNAASIKPVDTCVWTFMYKSMEVQSPAICANGTQALFATYSRPGCKPDDLKYLGEIPEEFADSCGDISKIDSFAFICEGLPESEIGNKGNAGGFFKFVGILLLILILMIALSIASCCLRGAAMMKQANELWARIMNAFKGREGAIQL
ncbi:hypothetical protein N431DRAFT_432019 [Stipitochalara longipes BDJ]|nr:hypothetical protein N431DRAFT_432019 [Stipitochalara longipes BDJ]